MSKLAILGAGGVGATIAYAALIRGVAQHVALYDVNRAKADAEALDLAHGATFFPEATVEAGDDLAICRGARVVVVAAGAKQRPGQTRLDLAAANVAMLRDLLPRLVVLLDDRAILVLVSNPVDVLTEAALRITGWPRERVIGSGTVLDSARFRERIARRLRVAPQSVHASIVGEHGESAVPLWSTANVGGVPLSEWAVPGHGKLSVRDRAEIFAGVKDAAAQIIAGKGATTFAIGLACAEILRSILTDARRALPVSTRVVAGGPLELPADVCLSLPCLVGASGAEPPLTVPMNDAERAGLRRSAEVLREACAAIGLAS